MFVRNTGKIGNGDLVNLIFNHPHNIILNSGVSFDLPPRTLLVCNACQTGQLDFLKAIHACLNPLSLAYGLFYAARAGHLDIINYLIENGADNWENGLSGACHGHHPVLVCMFIIRGAKHCSCMTAIEDHPRSKN